jgi:endoglucanase
MKTTLTLLICLSIITASSAQISLREVRTASNNVVVAFFMSPDITDLNANLAGYKLNGATPQSIAQFSTLNRGIEEHWKLPLHRGFEHRVYLTVPQLVNGTEYTLVTPHGSRTFTFDERKTFCESIRTNQSGYSALSKVRYANFSIWLGTGGSKTISGTLPDYEVFEIRTNKTIAQGTLKDIGACENAGDHVYRIDLSAVPEGGPYKITVKGYGCSYPFGVGGMFSRRLAYVQFRGLMHLRCGMELKQPYCDYDYRGACHTQIYVTNSPIAEASINVGGNDPLVEMHGGYHDAGDCDRRAHHIITPMVLLTAYEAFPECFSDKQFNIPDSFDIHYKPLGKGNGIPDIIDEAAWGALIWEQLQESSGGVRWGTNCNGYPETGPTVDKETKPYGTMLVENRATAFSAGVFAQLARALKPYNPSRAAQLQQRAEKAWAYAGGSAGVGYKLYYAVQYYLLTGDEAAHATIEQLAGNVSSYPGSTITNAMHIIDGKAVWDGFFFSYIIQKERPTKPAVVKLFTDAIRSAADDRIKDLEANYYPNGVSPANLTRWWGSPTAQAQYGFPCLLQWRLTKEQKYIDAASVLADYNQGVNPSGKCYLTGIGFNRVHDPLSHDSYSVEEKGWGPHPGLQVFGPGNTSQMYDNPQCIPGLGDLAPQRRYNDSHRIVSINEFTVQESITYPAAVYPILAVNGSYDGKSDPFDPSSSATRDRKMPLNNALYLERVQMHEKELRFGFNKAVAGAVTVELYSMQGERIMRHQTASLGTPTLLVPLPSKAVAPGIYICQIETGKLNMRTRVTLSR